MNVWFDCVEELKKNITLLKTIIFATESLKFAADAIPFFPFGLAGSNLRRISKSSISDGHFDTNIWVLYSTFIKFFNLVAYDGQLIRNKFESRWITLNSNSTCILDYARVHYSEILFKAIRRLFKPFQVFRTHSTLFWNYSEQKSIPFLFCAILAFWKYSAVILRNFHREQREQLSKCDISTVLARRNVKFQTENREEIFAKWNYYWILLLICAFY